jgi:hypothetical protein
MAAAAAEIREPLRAEDVAKPRRRQGTRKVRWQNHEVSLAELAQQWPLRRRREVEYKGRRAVQRVAEAEVLDRPAWRRRRRQGRWVNERVPGPPITLRLVSRVCDTSGRTLAVWYLLTNQPAAVDTATVALWYDWWRVESLFKLLKGHRQQVEHWQQEGGEALATGYDAEQRGGTGDGSPAGLHSRDERV